MQYPYYDMTVPVFTQQLKNISAILDKAEAFARERKVEEGALLNARLHIDMFPLVRQVQIASDNAKGTAYRLAGLPVPSMDDTETSFVELRARLTKTIELLAALKPEQFANASTVEIRLPYFKDKYFVGAEYVPYYALPNFFFHAVTAYDILRHLGVVLGKADFAAGVPMHDEGGGTQ